MLLLERGFAFVVSCAPATAAPSAVSAVTAANNLVMRGSMVCSPVRPLLAPAGRQLGGRHRSRESFRSTGHRRGNANVLKHRLCRTERPIALSSNDRLASSARAVKTASSALAGGQFELHRGHASSPVAS